MENKEKQRLFRFRTKHDLAKVWLPKRHIKTVTDMIIGVDKTLEKELVEYLRKQKKEVK